MSVTLYFPTKASPTTTITLANVDWYPSSRPVQRTQSRRLTPGGTAIVYNLGLTNRFLNMITRHISETDKDNLKNFITNEAAWSANTFEIVDGQDNLFTGCRYWFDEFDFTQTSVGRFEEEITIKYSSVVIVEESLSFTITSSMTESHFFLLPLSFTIVSSMTISESFFDNNTPWCGSEADKLYLQSGQFTATLKDSEDVNGIDTGLSGISWDGTNTPWCGSEADKLYLQSGQFTATLKDSEDVSGIDTGPTGISWDGTNTPWSGSFADKLYLQSGQFTATLKDSEAVGGIDNLPLSISYDGTNTPWCGSEASKLYLQSGQFTATLKDSEDVSGIDTSPSGISWDGTNTLWCGNEADKLYLQSGQFTATLKDSEDVSGIDNNTSDIDTNRYDLRLGI